MCTKKDFDSVFKALVRKKEVDIIPNDIDRINISFIDFQEAIDRLVVLGFASKTRFLNGNELAEITTKGKEMYKVMH